MLAGGAQRVRTGPRSHDCAAAPRQDGNLGTRIRVVLRLRPSFSKQVSSQHVWVDSLHGTAAIVNPRNPSELLSFSFEKCHGDTALQSDIFRADVMPLVDKVLAGFNATIFAYGNTGAGKTFTMNGTASAPGTCPER